MPAPTRTRPIARRALAAQSDERLVRLLRENYPPAFDEIVRRYQQPLTAFAAAIVPFHRAEEVVQASLLKAHKALLADDREVSLRAWLFTIVRNGALNVIRDEPDWQELDPSYDGVPQPPAIAEQNEELQALVTAICALPQAQRTALVGREIQGEGHAELAAQLGTTSTAVRGLIFRARTTLRNSLGAAIPLPVLRLLLIEAPAIGAAGIGGATLGGGTKLAAALSAAALAVGGGVAIQRNGGENANQARAAEKPAGESVNAAPASRASGAPATSQRTGSATGTKSEEGSSGGGDDPDDSGGRSGDSSGAGAGDVGEDGGNSGPGRGEDEDGGGHSGPGEGGHSGHGGGEPEEGGSSGPGGGGRGHGGGEPEEGGSSGPGGGGHGSGGGEPEEDEDNSSGKGGGGSSGQGGEPEARSDSGGSGPVDLVPLG